MALTLAMLQIESPEADAIASALGGTVARNTTGGRWVAEGAAGELRVDHDAPLRPAATIVGELAREHGLAITERRSLVTHEGEFAALATLARGDKTLHVGVVFAGARLTLVIVRCSAPTHRDALAKLAELAVVSCRLEAGRDRRRAYLYEPPPGWFAVRGFQRTTWYGPGHPNAHSMIEIADATSELDIDRVLANTASASTVELDPKSRRAVPLRTTRNLTGRLHQYTGARGEHVVEVVCVLVARYNYPMRLEASNSSLADSRRAFQRVVGSLHPLPAVA